MAETLSAPIERDWPRMEAVCVWRALPHVSVLLISEIIMNFSTDRDLLVHEPTIFTDAPFVAQQRVHVTDGVLSGTQLTSADADFESAQVEPGSVVLVGRTPYEVVQRVDGQTLVVSLLRTKLSDEPMPGSDATDLDVKVRTFAPQAALMREALLRLLGIDPSDPHGPLTEDAVVSLSVMARLEALGTLERVYSGAAALSGDNEALRTKAREYGRRFHLAAAQSTVLVDVDGDGHADERRHLGLVRLKRA